MINRTLKAPALALLTSTALFALAAPAQAVGPLDVPSGSTYTLATDEGYDTLTGTGTVNLYDYVLTIGADDSSSTFDGDIIAEGPTAYVGSWVLSDGPAWGGFTAPTNSAVQVAAMLFGGTASDYQISINGTDPTQISHTAHYDQIYVGPGIFADTYYYDNGNGLYDNPGDASAYVQDNTFGQVNYAFTASAGIGGLAKVGNGTLTLNGTGNWTGQTQVLGGTLQGTTASISGGSIVVNGGSLFYNQAFSGTVTQDIGGSGVVTAYAPDQTLTFSGDLTNGRLNVGSDTTVELQGTNTFADTAGVWVANNGVLHVIEGASVSASEIGVLGSGVFMTLDNQGSITGTAYYGVNPYSGMITNGAAANTDALISGGHTGIIGGGSLTVDNFGMIEGGTNDGINAWGGSLTLTNHADAVITGAGTAGGTSGYGAVASGTLAGTNDGSILGRFSGLRSNGALAVTNNGLIGSGSLDGMGAFVYSNGNNGVEMWGAGTLTNSASGQVLGNWNGVYTAGANGSIILNAGEIHGQQNGVYATANTSVTNQLGGQLTGSNAGMYATALSSLDNAGSVTGGNQGVHLVNGGTVTNSGSISGGTTDWWQRSVLIQGAAGTVTNQAGATITGGRGVDFENVGGTVDNSGTITGSIDGVQISGTGIVSNYAGAAINGHDFGVRVIGANSTVTNFGTISASNGSPAYFAVRMDGANATLNNNGGMITGANGVYLASSGTLTNSGQIHGTNGGGDGVQVGVGAMTVTNTASAVIAGGRIGVSSFGAGLSLDNSGYVGGSAFGAVYTSGGTNVITNRAGATIDAQGSAYGLNLRGTNTITNEGSITSVGQGGIAAFGASTTLTNNGTISGATHGIILNNTGATTSSVTNNTGATINGGTYNAVYTDGANAQLTNAGTMTGGNAAIFSDGADLHVNNSGLVRETGAAAGLSGRVAAGIYGSGADAMINNSGTISVADTDGRGIVLTGGGGTVTNLSGGTIVGGTAGKAMDLSGGTYTVDLRSGSATTGLVDAAASTGTTVTVAGSLNGGFNGSATGVDTFSLASTGTMAGAVLDGGNDAFTTFGGAISGNVDAGAGTDSLTFDVAGSITYAANFTAFETGTKTGAGRVNLTGVNAVNTMFVNGGVLAVNGILGSAVTVNSGGSLGGIGTIDGSLVVASGGHLAPGNSIGTLHVTGPVTFAAGSTYDVEIDPTASDQLIATGAVTINGGAVNVIGTGTAYSPLTTYAIIQGSSVTGAFDSVVDNLAFLDPTLTYSATAVMLEMRRNDIDFADVAGNPNQVAVAGGVQSLGSGSLYDAILVQDAGSARVAYDALSGDLHPTSVALLGQQGDRLRVAQLDRAAEGGEGFALWADASAGVGSAEFTDHGAAKATDDHRDLLAGLRFAKGGLSLVAGGGRSSLDIDQRRNGAEADVDSWLVGGQVGFRSGGLSAKVGVTYADHDVDTARAIRFPGFAEDVSASRGGNTRSLYGEVAYTTDLVGLHLEPFVGASRQKVSLDAVTESGGDAALSIDRIRARTTLTEVGIRFGGSANASVGGLYPVGTLAWQHLMGDRAADMTAAFDGGDAFTIRGAERSRDGLRANLGFGYRVGPAQLQVSYDGRVSERDVDHAVRASVSIGF